jgi:hypothetical protein
VVRLLLARQGVDVNKTNQNGATALYVASQNGHVEVEEPQHLLPHGFIYLSQSVRRDLLVIGLVWFATPSSSRRFGPGPLLPDQR